MANSITHTHEDINGYTHEYDVSYIFTKGYYGSWEQPPEPPEVEILSITENGLEVNITEALVSEICEQIFENEEDFDGYEN